MLFVNGSWALVKLVLMLLFVFKASQAAAIDLRGYQHGVEIVKLSDTEYRVFWSSSPGMPPRGINKVMLPGDIKCEYFTHDIYSAQIDLARPFMNNKSLISMPEAQEPVSAAVIHDGKFLVTFEDGSESDVDRYCNGNVQQRYQLFDSAMQPVTDIKTVSVTGGHSGHVAAAGKYFVLTYAEGWVDGGGVDGAGTANDIHLDVIDVNGNLVRHRGVAVDKGRQRDWWPLIAGSNHNVMLVWQRYVDNDTSADLLFSLYDPDEDRLVVAAALLKTKINYYHYDVQYLPGIDRFLVVGNRLLEGVTEFAGGNLPVVSPRMFAVLLDNHGRVISQWDDETVCRQCGSYHFYNLVREAQPAISSERDQTVRVLYPIKPDGLLMFTLSADGVIGVDPIDTDHYWFPLGSDGIFADENTAYFVNLTPTGIKSINVNILK